MGSAVEVEGSVCSPFLTPCNQSHHKHRDTARALALHTLSGPSCVLQWHASLTLKCMLCQPIHFVEYQNICMLFHCVDDHQLCAPLPETEKAETIKGQN